MLLGIDIGPRTAWAARLSDDGGSEGLALGAEGGYPAVVRQTLQGLVAGPEAARSLAGNAETTLVGAVRLLGGSATWPAQLAERLAFPVRDIDGQAWCDLVYAEVSAASAYGLIARALVDAAEAETGEPCTGVVLTVPAGAEHRLRVAAKNAVAAQGLTVRRIINQPTAALLAAQVPGHLRTVAVINCGDGATEASIAELGPDGIVIKSVASDMLLGGDDLIWTVTGHVAAEIARTSGIDVFGADSAGIAKLGLWHATAASVRELGARASSTIAVDHGGGFGRDIIYELRGADAERWLGDHYATMRTLCERALRNSGLSSVDAVLWIGEATWLPGLTEALGPVFGPGAVRIEAGDGRSLAARGAALAGSNAGGLIWDVTPYPLGINCYYGEEELFSPIIQANTPVPTAPDAWTQSYQTRHPDQTDVRLDLLQYRGPRRPATFGSNKVRPEECELLGSWSFAGLKPKRGKRADFTVTFAIDGDGIVHLTAIETATGHRLAVATDLRA